MRLFIAFLSVFSFINIDALAQQENVWSLQRCIKFAIEHNTSIRQDSLTARLARYTVLESKYAQIPTVNVSGSYGKSCGRSVNPTTNQFVEGSYNTVSPSATVSAVVFGGLQVRNNIARNKFSLEASLADLDQLKDDISLNVANGFLVALLAQEQINISKSQVTVSKAQLEQTRAFANAGRLPELNVAQLESQLATDSANLINSIASYNSAILDLKAMMNLDFSTPFSIDVPDAEVSGTLLMSSLQPEDVYEKARDHFGAIKGSKLRVSAAERSLAAAKGKWTFVG